MPPPDGWRVEAGLYSPAFSKTRAPASGPRGSKMLLGQNEDATLEGLGTERCAIRKFAAAMPTSGSLSDVGTSRHWRQQQSATKSRVGRFATLGGIVGSN
jgi:hypothetical protein